MLQVERYFERVEQVALDHVQRLGFGEARRTPPGRDAGLDIVDNTHGLAAQVKALSVPVGRPVIQQLLGSAASINASLLACFSVGGYSSLAVECADEMNVALFVIDASERVTAANRGAEELRPPSVHVRGPGVDEGLFVGTEAALRGAAQRGSLPAFSALGRLLEAKGRAEAISWYRRGAALGDVASAVRLQMLDEWPLFAPRATHAPTGHEADVAELRRWAQNGEVSAFGELGALLESRGYAEAEAWYRRGAAAGDPASVAWVKSCDSLPATDTGDESTTD